MCHHGHQVHLDDRRHRHRDDRRNRHRHRDDRRNRHRCLHRHRDDPEHQHARDAHRVDRYRCDQASCPGSGVVRRDGDRRRQQQRDGHLADEASPGWEQRGCCLDEQPRVPRGPPVARGLRDRRGACPDSARRGCFRGVGLRDAARGEGRRRRPHVRRVPLAPKGKLPWARASWLTVPWVKVPAVRAPWAQAPPDVREHEAHQRRPRREPRSRELRQPAQRQPREPAPREPQRMGPPQVPAQRGQHWQGGQQVPAWLRTSWRPALRRPP